MRKTFKVSSLTKIKTLFILVVYQPWGVMKKFVNWCHTIDTIYALLSNFIKNKKKQTSKCRENWIPLRRWLILLISTNTKTHACGIVICRSRCRVPLFFYNVIAVFFMLLYILAGYTGINYKLNRPWLWDHSIWRIADSNPRRYSKNPKHARKIRLTQFNNSTLTQRLRKNVTKWFKTAMLSTLNI